MSNKNCLMPCTITEGMFSSEYAVEVRDNVGSSYSLFVPKDVVNNGNGNKGKLHVDLVKKEKDSGWVFLPAETLETGTRTIRVSLTELVGI
jgi:hypothetical protein